MKKIKCSILDLGRGVASYEVSFEDASKVLGYPLKPTGEYWFKAKFTIPKDDLLFEEGDIILENYRKCKTPKVIFNAYNIGEV